MFILGHLGETDAASAVLFLVATVAAFLYFAAAQSLALRGRSWGLGRQASFVLGCALVMAAAGLPLVADPASFSVQVAQHLLLGMFAPLALVLAAPSTLAMRTLPRPAKRRLVALMRSRFLGVIGHPVSALAIDTGVMVALYTTPLYELAHSGSLAHAVMLMHVLLAGCLFVWAIVGIEATRPRGTDHRGR